MTQPTAIVFGAGAIRGIGAAVARRFAREGYHVIVTGRTLAKIEQVVAQITALGIGSAEALQVDATDESQVTAAFDRAMSPGPGREAADVIVSNAGNNALIDFTELSAAQFEDFWRVGCYSGFLVGREAARRLLPLGRGTVIFTGASGSLRGKPGFAHFAAAKAGLRMISQSMAREYGPKGLHVAHVIVDGGVLGDRLEGAFPQMVERLGADGLLDVDAIAENYWTLHRQPKSAWTQELDLRPGKEIW
ncbi:SDR family NAD(P)-dependent oxidoreductase [Xanthomonas hortorum]|uniref:SDR family NAD(P)-dependent oxidoreductase n=1 Tax=Xanthomonas hortorum pv. hederae TaxID=453603 RepID=A0A9X4BUF7_9XANT|nr:SDR family NAD(P)-dependent oxidoreductase [Xanthomonas hortorum]MCE4372383.1 SDR family NAD(P)-dependent oxidoreductase [Xanthomonas hortorum pv. hederae]MDC8639846.1 SDR family NAD(P)-dependent oxidoreductase [Xanthomonas hortorum pv. hederae]PPU79397.1 glucose 1-dehydrogenase [Xanthomonas hortorum pv. hederae]PUE99091.1 KR domain-containing protein [Xanthomonas hortorum pv. hederae]